MTTTLDPVFRELARSMIGLFGTSATLSRTTKTFNEVQNKIVSVSNAQFSLRISPPTSPTMNQLSEDVLKTDWLCSTPALNQDKTSVTWGPPNIEKDTLIFGGIEYRIVGWQPVYSGDQLAMYKLQLRV